MKKINIFISCTLLLLITACSEDYLEKFPKDQLTEATTFTTNTNFETYAWGLYSNLNIFNDAGGWGHFDFIDSEYHGDLLMSSSGSLGSSWLWQRVTVPSSSSNWNSPYVNIRKANLMIDNIDNSQLTAVEKDHWRSVGYFFRAYQYIKLISKYGAVPWVDKALSDGDVEALYGERTSRDIVAQNILNDLKWAEAHLNEDGNGNNTINPDVVRVLISRFGLFEGTWRKYHSLGDENTYLQASADASAQLIENHPSLHPKYDEVFNSISLEGVNGILLYKQFEYGQLTNRVSWWNRSSIGTGDLTKKAVDSYLCIDGQTRWTSPLFDGDQDEYDEFRNRDERLYFTVVPPFRVDTDGKNQLTWEYTDNPKHREYIDLMENLTDGSHKSLPTANWRGLIVRTSPHFRKFNEGHGYNVSYTGYRGYKHYNRFVDEQDADIHDGPIFRMGEVLVNYAEAMYELGKFTQNTADLTINKLRERGSVAPLTIGNVYDDPTRDTSVDPILWEIRRERGIELMSEGFRFDDLRRWKKVNEYAGVEKLGRYVVNANYNNTLPIQGGASEGYISPFGVPPGFLDHYYLYPIPSDQIVLNPKITQNPGWE